LSAVASIGFHRLSPEARDLEQAKLAIESLRALEPVLREGSVDDAIVRPDGAIVTPGAIDRAIGPDPRAYQVTQNAPDAVEIEVVGGPVSAAQERLAPLFAGMKVMARAATAISVEPNGKYRTAKRTNVPLPIEAAFATGAV
jgi:hypothetical protein